MNDGSTFGVVVPWIPNGDYPDSFANTAESWGYADSRVALALDEYKDLR